MTNKPRQTLENLSGFYHPYENHAWASFLCFGDNKNGLFPSAVLPFNQQNHIIFDSRHGGRPGEQTLLIDHVIFCL